MKNYKIKSINKTWGLILFVFFSFSLKSQNIQFLDCKENKPLEGLLIFSENDKYIGFTSENGILELENSISKIKIIGLNIRDTTLSINGINSICLTSIHYNLQEFEIEEKSIAARDLYLKMLTDSWKTLQIEDTILYYTFSYIITIPDSNWTEKLNGVIKVEQNQKMRFPLVKYCNIHHKADTNFTNSSIYKHNRLFDHITIALDLTYFKAKDIPKHVKKMKNIKFTSSGENMMFSMSRSKNKAEQKVSFKNGLIVRNEVKKTFDSQIFPIVNSYLNTEYTQTENKVINKLYSKKVLKHNNTFFVSKFDISLIQEEYKGKDFNFPVGINTYQKWIEMYNGFLNKTSN